MRKIVLISMISFLFISCSDNQIIKINCNKLSNDKFSLEILKSIALETNDNSIIGKITQIVYAKNKIFLFDWLSSNTVTCFSDSGNFLFRIKSGRGPGELIAPVDFAVNNNELIVVDQNKLKKYDLKGSFISEKVLNNGLYFYKYELTKDSNFLVFGNSPSLKKLNEKKQNPGIRIEDILTQYKLINKSLDEEIATFLPLPKNLMSITCYKPINRFGDRLLCLAPPQNIIYSYSDLIMTPKYQIEFGKYSYKKRDIKKGEEHLIEQLRDHKKYGFPDYINETKKFITFSFVKQPGLNTFIIYSKETNQAAEFGSLFNVIGINNIDPLTTSNDSFVCVLYPSRIPDGEFSRINKILGIDRNINESSNPVILLVRINEK